METLPGIKPSTLRLPHLSTNPTHLQTRIQRRTRKQAPEDPPQTPSHPTEVVEHQPRRQENNQRTQREELRMTPQRLGTGFCVIQQDTYTQVALDHLSDSNTYQKMPRMSAKTVENKVNSTWKNICLQNEFPSFVRKTFLDSNTDLPKFYHLIKTRKTGPEIKIRPIVSNLNGPTHLMVARQRP